MEHALYGSFLPIPPEHQFPLRPTSTEPRAGAVVCLKKKIRLNEGRKRWRLKVKNQGDRPIQVSRVGVFPSFSPSLEGTGLAFCPPLRFASPPRCWL